MKALKSIALLGGVAGFLNGIFGSGGGLTVVPMLEHQKIPPQKSHATSVAIILPLSIASAMTYLLQKTTVHINVLLWIIPFGLIGAWIGSKWLKKINSLILKRAFALIMIYAGIRMFF